MRHVPLTQPPPDDRWLKDAAALLLALKSAPNKAARDAIIDTNADCWGKLKAWLLSLSHGKCWFSEASDCFSHFHVEHYRPKKSAKELDGAERDGYWWLAFDWRNFRICGGAGNAKKGTFFPLRRGSRPASGPEKDLRFEDPLLLDPSDPHDPVLLFFNLEGRAIAAPDLPSGWDRDRVAFTISRCNLDFSPLVEKRKVIWSECWRRINLYRDELEAWYADETNVIAKTEARNHAIAIREMLQDVRELSAVARACVLSSGDPRVVGLLQSV